MMKWKKKGRKREGKKEKKRKKKEEREVSSLSIDFYQCLNRDDQDCSTRFLI